MISGLNISLIFDTKLKKRKRILTSDYLTSILLTKQLIKWYNFYTIQKVKPRIKVLLV